MRGRATWGAIAAAIAAAAVAGCGSGDDNSSASADGGKKQTIAYVSYSLQAKNQQDLNAGIKAQAAKYGYAVKSVDSGGDVAKANSLMSTMVTQKVDGIVIDSFGDQAMQAGILAAKAAKIPVYAAYNWGRPKNVAGSVLLTAATEETNRMLADLGDKGAVLAFTLPGAANCTNGEQIFDKIMKGHPDVKVTKHATKAPGWQEDAASTTKAWLASHPSGEPLAIWGCWDGPSVGATAALTAAGRKDVKVYGDYGEADAINAVKAKKYTATWYFDGRALGSSIVDMVHANADVAYADIKPKYTSFPPIEVNQDNVTEFIAKHPDSVEGS